MLAAVEVVFDETLAPDLPFGLFVHLAPDIRSHVLERPGVERIAGDLTVDVVVPEADVIPFLGAEVLARDLATGAGIERSKRLTTPSTTSCMSRTL